MLEFTRVKTNQKLCYSEALKRHADVVVILTSGIGDAPGLLPSCSLLGSELSQLGPGACSRG